MKALPTDHKALGAEIEKRARRYSFAVRSLLLFTATVVAAVLGTMLYVVILIRQQQVTNTAISSDTHANTTISKRLLQQFQDCVQPDGECAKENAAKTAHVLNQFQILVVIGNLCATDPHVGHNYPAFTRCVATLAAQHDVANPPK